MIDKVHVFMSLHNASTKSTAGKKTRHFSRQYLNFTRSFLILAETFRNDFVAASSTALRSVTEKNELGGPVTVPCPSNMSQHSSTADWLKF